jgi:hypothetical protein
MCGIFGYLDHHRPSTGAAGFFEAIGELTRIGSGPAGLRIHDLTDAERTDLLAAVARAQAETYAWMERSAFLHALGDRGLQARLRESAASVAAWTEKLEGLPGRTRLASQRDWETLNRLVVGGKDIAWQLGRTSRAISRPSSRSSEDPGALPGSSGRPLPRGC